MQLQKNIQIIDLALYLKKQKTLVIADTHIGYEEMLNKKGILIPRFQFKEIIKRLEKIFKALKKENIEKIIINGDIKEEFGTISNQEWRHCLMLIDFLSKYCKKLILLKGNHDTILGPIAKKRSIKVKDFYIEDNILIIHGHKKLNEYKALKNKKFSTIIIGHEHPAITLREKAKYEKFKCFLAGKQNRKNLIIMPSFNLVTEGIDILSERTGIIKEKKHLSPLIKNIDNFRVYIVSDKVYDFGPVKNLE